VSAMQRGPYNILTQHLGFIAITLL
jgi:hypothetical protein